MTLTTLAPSFKAGGNISPCRFVKITGAMTVSQCVAGERGVGVSQEGLKDVPIPGNNSSGFAAVATDPVGVFVAGEMALVEVAAATTAGQYLKSDVNGRGTPTSTANDIYLAQALEDQATVNGRVLCLLMVGKI
jgi:hypothetical protein